MNKDGGMMSSSSDIEKLFDHFGGDANAYQEIGRENEARSARTRWPLLVTLDLTQQAIPAIGQHREPKLETPVSAATSAVERQDTTPKDVAAVTRAKAPLFTRSHRRDIPPVVAAVQPAAPSGASRFGSLQAEEESAVREAGGKVDAVVQAAQYVGSASIAPVAPVAPAPFAHAAAVATVPPVATSARLAPIAAVPPAASVPPTTSVASAPPASATPAFLFHSTPPTQTHPFAQAATPTWTQAQALAQAFAPAPATAHAYAHAYAPATPAAPTQPTQPTSILGKLFTTAPQQSTPPQPAAPANESAPLQSVFDRLRSAPAPTSATPASASSAAASGVSNSWLVNGPRRS